MPEEVYAGALIDRFMGQIEGWAYIPGNDDTTVGVDVYRNGVFIETVQAQLDDPVLKTKGMKNTNHLFAYVFKSEDFSGDINSYAFKFSGTDKELEKSPLQFRLGDQDRLCSRYEGRLRPVEDNSLLRGWIADRESSDAVPVDIHIDGIKCATVKSNEYFNRITEKASVRNASHFTYEIPERYRDDSIHQIDVYVSGTDIPVYGSGVLFNQNHSKIVQHGKIGTGSLCSDFAELEMPVMVGRHSIIQKFSSIGAYTYLHDNVNLWPFTIIGKYCSIASNVVIGPSNHNYQTFTTHPFLYDSEVYKKDPYYVFGIKKKSPSYKRVTIGHDVWIGTNAVILSGVTVGNGAVITKDIEPYTIVAGVPARPLKKRFEPEIIERLLKSEWWNLSVEQLFNIDAEELEPVLQKLESLRENIFSD